jgi:L-threonate 2-dehydrogenase
MGTALSRRLIDAGIAVIGFDIDPGRREELGRSGGTSATSLRELADRCDAIAIAVYSGAQVQALFDEMESGARRAPLICTTTCSPNDISRIAELASRAGFPFIEMPISGTSAEVRNGTATALVAGDVGAIDAINDVLAVLCPQMVRVGNIGDPSRTKLAINLILQANRAALAEGIVLAERLGLEGHAFLKAARASAAYSKVMDAKGEKMLARDFRPQSHISQTLKDTELILEEGKRHNLLLPITTAQANLLRLTISLEGPDCDSSAVIEAIRHRSASKEIP